MLVLSSKLVLSSFVVKSGLRKFNLESITGTARRDVDGLRIFLIIAKIAGQHT